MIDYVKALRKKYRFPSNAGSLTLEQIWDLPLTHKTGLDLDSVARMINTELRSLTEESFVVTRVDPRKPELEEKLEIVKDVIATKIAEANAAATRAEKKIKRDKILAVLANQEEAALATATKEELLKQLSALDE